MSVSVQIKNYQALKQQLEDMKKAPKAVMKAMTSDAKTRVPPWVAKEVSKVYGVSKGDVSSGTLGKMTVRGDVLKDLTFTYRGHLLTPTHFGMMPKAPKTGGSYTLKATIIRGQRATLSKVKKLTKKQKKQLGLNFRRMGTRNSPTSPYMLQTTGAKSASKTQFIPFQRQSQPGKMDHVMRTVSLPQMVSGRASEGIHKAINDGLQKRLEHHMKRYMG